MPANCRRKFFSPELDAPLTLDSSIPHTSRVTMQLNKVHSVKTIERVAAELGETVELIFELAIDMETEDGVIWVYGLGDDGVIAFTPFGIENLQERIEMHQRRAH